MYICVVVWNERGISKANMTCKVLGGNLAAGAASHLGGSPPLEHADLKDCRGPHPYCTRTSAEHSYAVRYVSTRPLHPMDALPPFAGLSNLAGSLNQPYGTLSWSMRVDKMPVP